MVLLPWWFSLHMFMFYLWVRICNTCIERHAHFFLVSVKVILNTSSVFARRGNSHVHFLFFDMFWSACSYIGYVYRYLSTWVDSLGFYHLPLFFLWFFGLPMLHVFLCMEVNIDYELISVFFIFILPIHVCIINCLQEG